MENNTFTVLPMSQRINLQAGETYEGSITVVNPADSTEDFAYQISVLPYGVTGTDNAADLVTDTNYTVISKWITVLEPSGKIAPNESKEIKFTINVPENAPAGGQYAAIAVSSDADTSASEGVSVQNVFELASIIYAHVAGETVHDGEIVENNIPGFVTSAPVTLSAYITNRGNIHEDATFIIKVSDFFSGQVILPTEENEGQYNEIIMPDSERYIEREISDLPSLGVVKVSQTIYYNGEVSQEEKEIIICPLWFIALVLLTITAIIFTIVQIVKKHKKTRRNKSIAV
ncbi:hypothetical protein IJG89_03250 [Candidatus Saccharibacteria bacterium]|nr:hypothetical protein [Candidatus Saccharibacteria bacterium]